MRKIYFGLTIIVAILVLNLAACSDATQQPVDESKVARPDEMSAVADIVGDDLTPIVGSDVKDGTYPIAVDSSSSMFSIEACELVVENGNMTAHMTMGGTGYRYVYIGTGEQAVTADEDDYISYEETDSGFHIFSVPVEALDKGINCAAFSKKKEKWYDRTLVFRADSLPITAFRDGVVTTLKDLAIADGIYQINVTLNGGSGKAAITSPATITVEGQQATAKISWSSSNYDYMKIDDVQYDAIIENGHSVFSIPVSCFDWNMPVIANTTAMSEPHEIAYSLRFDSASMVQVDK